MTLMKMCHQEVKSIQVINHICPQICHKIPESPLLDNKFTLKPQASESPDNQVKRKLLVGS